MHYLLTCVRASGSKVIFAALHQAPILSPSARCFMRRPGFSVALSRKLLFLVNAFGGRY